MYVALTHPSSLLLVSSPQTALQIFVLPLNTIPSDPHQPETFPPPEEIFCLHKIRYSDAVKRSSLPGVRIWSGVEIVGEEVIQACMLDDGLRMDSAGPMIVLM
jgi:hypothetical protein